MEASMGKSVAHLHEGSHSQCGEDLIVKAMCDRVGIESGTVVEFGAGDGVHLSNAYSLVAEHSWRALFIEPDPKRFRMLRRNLAPFRHAVCLQRIVGLEPPSTLDEILTETQIPEEFEFLSIDVDGIDFHVWKSLSEFRPKFVLVEYNPSFPNHIRYVQEADMNVTRGSSPLALVELGKSKGYELVATSPLNCLFVRADIFPRLGIKDNRLETLRDDYSCVSWMVQFYDGTTALYGCRSLLWHGASIQESVFQVVPSFLRIYPPRAGRIRRHALGIWRWYRRARDRVPKKSQGQESRNDRP